MQAFKDTYWLLNLYCSNKNVKDFLLDHLDLDDEQQIDYIHKKYQEINQNQEESKRSIYKIIEDILSNASNLIDKSIDYVINLIKENLLTLNQEKSYTDKINSLWSDGDFSNFRCYDIEQLIYQLLPQVDESKSYNAICNIYTYVHLLNTVRCAAAIKKVVPKNVQTDSNQEDSQMSETDQENDDNNASQNEPDSDDKTFIDEKIIDKNESDNDDDDNKKTKSNSDDDQNKLKSDSENNDDEEKKSKGESENENDDEEEKKSKGESENENDDDDDDDDSESNNDDKKKKTKTVRKSRKSRKSSSGTNLKPKLKKKAKKTKK